MWNMLLSNRKTKYFVLLVILKAILIPKSAVAQTLSPVTQTNLEPEIKELYLPPESGRLKLDLSSYDTDTYLGLEQLPENIDPQKIKIVGNTVIGTAELEALIGTDRQGTISKNELRAIIKKINFVYRDRDYITSGVFTEPKLERNGIIFIPVTEGRIEEIEISGLSRLRDGYIRQRLFKDGDRIFNREQLIEALQLLQVDRLIDDISATVVPGSSLGNNILEVEVREDDLFYLEVSLDNLGTLPSGSFRRQLKVNHDSVFGLGDRFYAAYTNTDGLNYLDNIGYSLPFNTKNGRVSLNYGFGKAELINEPFDTLDVDLEFQAFNLSLYQPVYRSPKQELALGVALSYVDTQTTVFDEPFQVNRSANEDGELNIAAVHFYQDYIRRGRSDRFDLRSQLSLGVDIFDATQNADDPDSNFFIWRGQTSYLRQLSTNFNLSLKYYWQLSDRPLFYFEKTPRKLFTLAREEESFILRGYGKNTLRGDNGVYASAELQANVLKIDKLNSVLQFTPFIDFGTVWNNDDLEFEESTLIAAGLGIRLLVNDNFRARVDWGIPLIELETDGGSLQEDGITFNIEYRPF